MVSEEGELTGLGGWLLLVGVRVLAAPVAKLISIASVYRPLLEDGTWEALTTEGTDAYDPLWEPLLVGEIAANLLLVAASVYLIYLFFSKHYSFPKFFIGLYVLEIVFVAGDAWLFSFMLPNVPVFDEETLKQLARLLVGAAVWIPYMLVSKRVANTFVRRPQQPA